MAVSYASSGNLRMLRFQICNIRPFDGNPVVVQPGVRCERAPMIWPAKAVGAGPSSCSLSHRPFTCSLFFAAKLSSRPSSRSLVPPACEHEAGRRLSLISKQKAGCAFPRGGLLRTHNRLIALIIHPIRIGVYPQLVYIPPPPPLTLSSIISHLTLCVRSTSALYN